MANKYFEYFDTLGEWNDWTTAVTPFELADLPKVAGFDLGAVVETGRARAPVFTQAALRQVWSAFPVQGRDAVIDGVQTVLNQVGGTFTTATAAMSAVLQGVAAGAGVIAPIISGSFELADMWVGVIEGILASNDKARRGARLKYMELMEDLGPRAWGGGHAIGYTYRRELSGLFNPDVFPMGWPPDWETPGPLRLSPADPYRGDCSRGDSDFSGGLDSSCRGNVEIFPLFYPIWCQRVLGANKGKRGMERTSDGGALVWAKMISMQAQLLGNPIANLGCDGRDIAARVKRFKASFWRKYFTPSEGIEGGRGLRIWGGSADDKKQAEAMGGPIFQIGAFDEQFPAGLKKGFFMTPGGLIGTYRNDGTGTTDHPDLGLFGVWRWPSALKYSGFGGNWISCRDYNTIVSAAGQFFALRTATLRRRTLSETMVKEFPNLLVPGAFQNPAAEGLISYTPIPEGKVRRAIEAIAAGATTERAPKKVAGIKVPIGVKPIPAGTFVTPGAMLPKTRWPVYVGAGAVALGAAGFAAWKLRLLDRWLGRRKRK